MNNLSKMALRLFFVAAVVAISFTFVRVATAFCISDDYVAKGDSEQSSSDKTENETYFKATSLIVASLTVTVAVCALLMSIIIFFYEKKKEKIDDKLKDLEKKNEISIKSILDEKLNRKVKAWEKRIEEEIKEHIECQSEKIERTTEPIEIRQNAAETVRWQVWHKIYPSLSDALKNNKWADFLSVWNDFHEFNLALASLLSPKEEEIFDALGKFVDKIPKEKIPDELWNLIQTLNKQKRFKAASIHGMLDRLGEKMGRSLNETLPSSQEGED